mmetsp:Transcript_95995/g.298917  ORF Transcript_95995/g.298917 Transcript_95995/m.298917 type:complete len:278 (+) Transcript_95995:492-1325(+)
MPVALVQPADLRPRALGHGDAEDLSRGRGEGDLAVRQDVQVEALGKLHWHQCYVDIARAASLGVHHGLAIALLLLLYGLDLEDLIHDLVHEAHRLRQRQLLRDVRIVALPPLHAELDVPLLRGSVPALLVAVQDHGDDEVHHEVQAHHDVADPVDDREDVLVEDRRHASVGRLHQALVPEHLELVLRVKEVRGRAPVARAVVRLLILGEVMHELVPRLSRRRPEERDERLPEVVEVAVDVEHAVVRLLGRGEEAHPQDAVERQDQEQDRHDVPQLGE